MTHSASRRQFLSRVASLSGVVTLSSFADADAPRPHIPAPSFPDDAHEAAYWQLIQQPVYKLWITPHWVAGNTRFWYRNDGPEETKEFVLVDAVQGTRAAAFNHARLAASLSQALGMPYHPERLPFGEIEFTQDGQAIQFQMGNSAWQCSLLTYACVPLPPGVLTAAPRPVSPDTSPAPPPAQGVVSPDGQWTGVVQNGNVFVRAGDGPLVAFTQEGSAEIGYDGLSWSPDSRILAGFRVTTPPVAPVYAVESAPQAGGTRGVLHTTPYLQPGDPIPTYEVFLFAPATKTAMRAHIDAIDCGGLPEIRWKRDGRRFTYEHRERGHQRFRVVEVDAHTGAARAIINERAQTFINASNLYLAYPHTDTTDEILYASEQDGWRHLYLYDRATGQFQNQVTRGKWVVREVDRVDAHTRQIWFRASGRNPDEDPYQMHLYRVNFDGTHLTALTEGDGEHLVQWSPDQNFLIDTYSRPDRPPIHTLRRGSDGSLICPLETADISGVTAQGWRPPQVFSAKGRDGITDIWGLVFRPLHFDPAHKYPVIENIYAGPQDSDVRKLFAVADSMQALAELGFIVVQCDGMGTRNRSKAFHDVCWHNLADAGLPDRIAWITALAHADPAVDSKRVGIYGTSAGGQNSTGALLFHSDFYKVAVSSCGCHDNRMDKQNWNEQWMGYPVGPWYGEQSNITHAHQLRGKLLLIVGELDTNVPPESTLRLTDALIKAGKDYELVVITGSDHTDGGPYGARRRHDFFIRHLLGVEPPDRNRIAPDVTQGATPSGSPFRKGEGAETGT